MLKQLVAAVAALALGVGLSVATVATADATPSTTATAPDDKCVVDVIHHPEVLEQSHQEYRWSKAIPGTAAVTHVEYQFQTRVKLYGSKEVKSVKGWNFVSGQTTRVNGVTIPGHWVQADAGTYYAIPDVVINAVWGPSGVPAQYLGDGSVSLSSYGGPSVTVKYHAEKVTTDAGYTDWSDWSDWSTTNPGSATDLMNVQTRTVTDTAAVPAKTVYYVHGGTPSDTLTAANWTTDQPGSPWTQVDQRKVVDVAHQDAWDENVYGTCPSDPCVSAGTDWHTENVAPLQEAAGLRFAGPQAQPVDMVHAVTGNLMGTIGSSYTIASAHGDQAALVYELDRTAGAGATAATVVIDPRLNGWAADQAGVFTVTATTKAWTSAIATGPGSQGTPATIAQLSALYPANGLTAQGIRLAAGSATGQFTVVSATAGCGDIAFGTLPAPGYGEPLCTGPGQVGDGTVTIPTAPAGVQYSVKVGSGSYNPVASGATVSFAPGTTVTVQAAGAGHLTTTFPAHTFTQKSGQDCLVDASVATQPAFQSAACVAATPGAIAEGSYTLYPVDHVSYEVSTDGTTWTPQSAGTYPAAQGSHVYVRASADAGYTLSGQSTFDHVYPTLGDSCLGEATPATPTVTDAVCDGPGAHSQAVYTVVAADHVHYEVSTDQGSTWNPVTVGDHDADAGSSVWIRAVADSGYRLTGESLTKLALGDPGACLVTSTPVMPSVTAQDCTVAKDGTGVLTDGEITIPATAGVQYSIDGTDASAGPHAVAPGDHTVAAIALTGYLLDASYTAPWTLTSGYADLCGDLVTHPLVAAAVVVVQPSCAAAGSFTLSNDLGTAGAVDWTVDGNHVTEGTFTAKAGTTVAVHAAPHAPDYGFDVAQQTDWSLTFADPAGCDLRTLALTGSTVSGVWIGAAVLLVLGGGLLVGIPLLMRRRRGAHRM